MELKAGRTYRNGLGKHLVMSRNTRTTNHAYPFMDQFGRTYTITGEVFAGIRDERSLLEEVTEYQQADSQPEPVTVDNITEHRGARYGTPLQNFRNVDQLYNLWLAQYEACHQGRERPSSDLESCVKQSVHMIMTKLARAAYSPDYDDNWVDVAGYAKCMLMTLEDLSND